MAKNTSPSKAEDCKQWIPFVSTSPEQEIYDRGDFVVLVWSDTSSMRFLVSEVAMHLASSVWSEKLSTPGSRQVHRSFGRKLPTIGFHGEPRAFRILLLLAHLQFKRLPVTLGLSDLAELARLCHRFDARDLVSKYAEDWISILEGTYEHLVIYSDAESNTEEDEAVPDAVKMDNYFWIIRVFGCTGIRAKSIQTLLEGMTETELRNLQGASIGKGKSSNLHSIRGLLLTWCKEFFIRTRKECMERIATHAYEVYSELLVAPHRSSCQSFPAVEQDECEFQRFGSMANFLRTVGSSLTVHNKQPSELIDVSLLTLKDAAKVLKIRSTKDILGITHKTCNASIVKLVDQIQKAEMRIPKEFTGRA